jgi:hypothetical protein
MSFQSVPDGIEAVVNATQNGVPIVNVYHVKTGGGVSDADLEAVASAVQDWAVDEMLPNQHTSYIIGSIVTTDLSVEGGHQVTHELTTDNTGGSSSEPLSGQAAAVVSWRTARIGRSYRGRTYLGGGQVGWTVSAQFLDPTFTAGLATIAQSLIDTLSALGYTLSVLSRVVDKVVRVTGVLTEIVAIIIDAVVDTQRRRSAN